MQRGDDIHLCWNRFLETGHPGNSGKWGEWVGRLCEDSLWEKLKPIALEYELVDRQFWIAGKLDGLFYDVETEEMVLVDLKTYEQTQNEKGQWSKPGKGKHRKQLGGYIDLVHINFPEITIDKALIVYATQRDVFYEAYPDVERCRADYQLARTAYLEKQQKMHSF